MKDGTIKIGDLNVSKINKFGMASTQIGTPFYASPEIWKDQPYDYKSDIWSIGCIIYELCQLKPPFRGTSLKNLCYNIQRGIYEPIMSFYSEELKKIIYLMLRTDPNMRPSTGQILKSKLINNKKKELKIGEELDKIEIEKYEKKELIRVVKNNEGQVFVDITGKANGRGAYIKKDLEVLELAKKSKVLDKHLETTISDEIYDELKNIINK